MTTMWQPMPQQAMPQAMPQQAMPQAMPQGMPQAMAMQAMPPSMPMPTMPTNLPGLQPTAPTAPTAAPATDSWAAVAAALGQLGYAMPAAPAATAAPAPVTAPAAAAPETDPLASVLASLGLGNINLGALNNLDLSSLSSIPGLESLASIPGLESLFPAGMGTVGTGTVAPGIVPSRSRGKGKAPKGKSFGKGKPLTQDLPVLNSQEVQEPGVFVAAASQKDERKCRALLAHKDFNRMDDKDSEQRTAVHICILKKMPEDISLNILNRDDFTEVNAIDQFGYTILSLAASNGMVGVCKAVLDHPEFTQVNSKDKWGATALHWAAASNLGSVCTSILEHPAFVEAHVVAFSFKFENQTALQVAEERGCADAEQAIKKALSV